MRVAFKMIVIKTRVIKIKILAVVVILSSFMLTGCSGLFIAGAAGGAASSQDRRTLPTQLEDSNIEI
ncbi:MAG: osmotically-inducible protein OsmY, partial [Polaribacter sp.]